MDSFWSDGRWSSFLSQHDLVKPYCPAFQKEASYQLAIGDEVYISSPETKSKKQILSEKHPSFFIEPGQFAFLLTAERVTTPFDSIGFISIRAKYKFLGLVNISGFHVDPGYSGKLIFAVFNAGPTRIHLQKGQRIFLLWMASLDGPISRKELRKGYDDIPSELITQISGDFTTAYQVKSQVDKIKEDVAELKAFKLRAAVIVGLVTLAFSAILFPILKERVVEILFHSKLSVSDLPKPTPPSAGTAHPGADQK
jgi:dCTP deaminase